MNQSPSKKPQRARSQSSTLPTSKVLSFLIAVLALLALDLSLVPSHRPRTPLMPNTNVPALVWTDNTWMMSFLVVAAAATLFWLWRQFSLQARELEKLRFELQQSKIANQTKSLFLANTSHEIRTPLGAILGFTKLLQDPGLGPTDREAYVGIIQKTGESLNSIINDILDLSKVEAGHMQIEKSAFALRPLLAEVLKICDAKYANKNIVVKLEMDPDVDETLYCDASRLQQILINIVGNALKFTEQGAITLSVVKQGSELHFKVRDSGVGIRPEDQVRLFQSFSQIENTLPSNEEGTGLGLVLSRNLARLLGGDLILEYSRPGAGSGFLLIIPREPVQESLPSVATVLPAESSESPDSVDSVNSLEFLESSAAETTPSAPAALAPATAVPEASPKENTGCKKVLLVDDSEINRLMMKRILHQRGLHVETANNGQEAVVRALDGDFDALLMDVQMPVMNGHEAARQLREKGYDRPIIALTAHAMKEDRDRCLEAGYSDYLSKPIQFEDLYSTLARVMVTPPRVERGSNV